MAGALEAKHRLSFWDALIVAAANRVNARYLLSEDMQDGQTFGETTIMNPFAG